MNEKKQIDLIALCSSCTKTYKIKS